MTHNCSQLNTIFNPRIKCDRCEKNVTWILTLNKCILNSLCKTHLHYLKVTAECSSKIKVIIVNVVMKICYEDMLWRFVMKILPHFWRQSLCGPRGLLVVDRHLFFAQRNFRPLVVSHQSKWKIVSMICQIKKLIENTSFEL